MGTRLWRQAVEKDAWKIRQLTWNETHHGKQRHTSVLYFPIFRVPEYSELLIRVGIRS
jgi:hypothetical protein